MYNGNEVIENENILSKSGTKNDINVLELEGNGLTNFLHDAMSEAQIVDTFVAGINSYREGIENFSRIYYDNDSAARSCRGKLITFSVLAVVFVSIGIYFIRAGEIDRYNAYGWRFFSILFFIPTFIFSVVAIVSLCYLNGHKGIIKESGPKRAQLENELTELRARAESFAGTIQYLNKMPRDYRNSLAIATMLNIMEKGRANNWMQLADKWEEQVHRWEIERSSKEALEYSKLIALYAESTAINSAATRTSAGVAAAASIMNLFWR